MTAPSQIVIAIGPNGHLIAEGPSGNNGARRRLDPSVIPAEWRKLLLDHAQAERERAAKAAQSRHLAVFNTAAADHGAGFARCTIGVSGRTLAAVRSQLTRQGLSRAEITALENSGRLYEQDGRTAFFSASEAEMRLALKRQTNGQAVVKTRQSKTKSGTAQVLPAIVVDLSELT